MTHALSSDSGTRNRERIALGRAQNLASADRELFSIPE
jgi:hypothetical protein